MATASLPYPALSFDVDYRDGPRNRLSVGLRPIFAIPALIVLAALQASVLALPVALMLLFRQRYPAWWFEWNRNYLRYSNRVVSYLFLLRDEYPATEEDQAVHLYLENPRDAGELNRWMPIVKWFLAIPHYIVLAFLWVGVVLTSIAAWFAILFTGRHPRALFDYVVGVLRWTNRVTAYAFVLNTDQYPPFRLSS